MVVRSKNKHIDLHGGLNRFKHVKCRILSRKKGVPSFSKQIGGPLLKKNKLSPTKIWVPGRIYFVFDCSTHCLSIHKLWLFISFLRFPVDILSNPFILLRMMLRRFSGSQQF